MSLCASVLNASVLDIADTEAVERVNRVMLGCLRTSMRLAWDPKPRLVLIKSKIIARFGLRGRSQSHLLRRLGRETVCHSA